MKDIIIGNGLTKVRPHVRGAKVPGTIAPRIEERETSRSVAHIAMIEYSDLVEINKALTKLVSEVEADCAANPDYLENRFITEDGFQIGYYVSKGKASWYLKLERYSSSTVFIKNAEALTSNFPAAQKKIEELKASNGK